MNKRTELIVNLSQEELYYLLSMLKTKTIPGLGNKMFEGTTERDIGIAVGVAERALLARGFLIPGESGMQVEQVPLVMVGTCARPEFSVIFEKATQKAASGLYWHGTKSFIVEHTVPSPGIHKFRALPPEQNLVDRVIASVSKVGRSTNNDLGGKISEAAYVEAQEVVQSNGKISKAVGILKKAGMSKENAEALASVMKNAEESIQAGFIHHHREGGDAEVFGGTLINSTNTSYLVNSLEEENMLEITPLNLASWKQWVKQNLIKITS